MPKVNADGKQSGAAAGAGQGDWIGAGGRERLQRAEGSRNRTGLGLVKNARLESWRHETLAGLL
jgi:hypothetical protein